MIRPLFCASAFGLTAAVAQTTNISGSILEYSGTQGTNGWSYGYYNLSADPGGVYSGAEFQALPSNGAGGYALGGNPPWTGIFNSQDTHPNLNGSGEHWTIRRYTVGAGEGGGSLQANWRMSKTNPNCGDGVIGYIFHNGVQIDTATLGFNDGTGFLRQATIPNVNVGDTIDLMLAPGANDGCDGSRFSMDLNRLRTYSGLTTSLIADSVAEFGQNTNGWSYGYYNTTLNGSPSPGDFIAFSGAEWTGSMWDLNPAASGPWSEITATGGHPNGTNSAPGQEHWVARRYTIQPGEAGDTLVEWNIAKANPFGSGTSVQIMLNDNPVASTGVSGSDTLGFNGRLLLPGLNAGDTVTIALAPQGLDAQLFGAGDNGDGSDASVFGMRLFNAIPEPGSAALSLAGLALLLRRRR